MKCLNCEKPTPELYCCMSCRKAREDEENAVRFTVEPSDRYDRIVKIYHPLADDDRYQLPSRIDPG